MKEISTGTLVWAALKSIVHKNMNKEMLGWTRHVKAPPVDIETAQAFAKATGDMNDAYFGSDPIVPPFFLARLVYPLLASAMLNPDLKLNLLRMVHGDMHMKWFRPIKPKEQLDLDLEVKSISETKAGQIVYLEITARNNEQKVAGATAGLLVRSGKKNHKPQRKNTSKTDKKIDFQLGIETRDGQQLQYAEVSGDHNFIHTNYLLARLAGLPRTIMHGMCVMAMSSAALVNQLASGDPTRLKEMAGRFASPVIPGQTLMVRGHTTEGITNFEVLTPSGKPAIKNGLVKIR